MFVEPTQQEIDVMTRMEGVHVYANGKWNALDNRAKQIRRQQMRMLHRIHSLESCIHDMDIAARIYERESNRLVNGVMDLERQMKMLFDSD